MISPCDFQLELRATYRVFEGHLPTGGAVSDSGSEPTLGLHYRRRKYECRHDGGVNLRLSRTEALLRPEHKLIERLLR